MTEKKPAWWPTAGQKAHADAGCAHPMKCNVDRCGAAYGSNPDKCYLPVGHAGTHRNEIGATWGRTS